MSRWEVGGGSLLGGIQGRVGCRGERGLVVVGLRGKVWMLRWETTNVKLHTTNDKQTTKDRRNNNQIVDKQ